MPRSSPRTTIRAATITFDVRAPNVDTEWYASVLRASAHGNEISDVTIRIVPESQIPALCGGADAAACYTGTVGPTDDHRSRREEQAPRDTLLHEYGHHLDTYWRVSGVPELNGTPVWWAARGMASLLAEHRSRSTTPSAGATASARSSPRTTRTSTPAPATRITWLPPPDAASKAALFAELGTPTEPLPVAPEVPLILNRRGTLVPRDRFSVPFSLLGPGRRVTVAATISKPKRKGIRARAQLVCDGRVVVSRNFEQGSGPKRAFDIPNLGPADCDVAPGQQRRAFR